MSETEVYCARGQDIESEAECLTAANALGKHWGSVFNTENDHRYVAVATLGVVSGWLVQVLFV